MDKKAKKARALRRNQERTTFNIEHAEEQAAIKSNWEAFEEKQKLSVQKAAEYNARVLRLHEVLDQCHSDYDLATVNVSKLENLVTSQEVENIVRDEVRKFAPYGEMDRAVQVAKDKILAKCRVNLSRKMGLTPDWFDVIAAEM